MQLVYRPAPAPFDEIGLVVAVERRGARTLVRLHGWRRVLAQGWSPALRCWGITDGARAPISLVVQDLRGCSGLVCKNSGTASTPDSKPVRVRAGKLPGDCYAKQEARRVKDESGDPPPSWADLAVFRTRHCPASIPARTPASWRGSRSYFELFETELQTSSNAHGFPRSVPQRLLQSQPPPGPRRAGLRSRERRREPKLATRGPPVLELASPQQHQNPRGLPARHTPQARGLARETRRRRAGRKNKLRRLGGVPSACSGPPAAPWTARGPYSDARANKPFRETGCRPPSRQTPSEPRTPCV